MVNRTTAKVVLPNEAGLRLDAWLVKHYPERSRTQWAGLVRTGFVQLDGRTAKSRHLLRRGQRVTILPVASLASTKAKFTVPIIYQDKDLVVVNKPAGIVMHPAGRHQAGTLLDWAEQKFSEAYLVHRLDKDTSGVVLIARNLKSKEFLSRLFANRLIKKTYLALVTGKLTPTQAKLDLPIARGRSGKFEVGAKGRSAQSSYKVIEYLPGYSLVEVHPESGRTHQIRVHFKALKHPIVGDSMYGQPTPIFSRQFLHAVKIEWVDQAGKLRQFNAPLPPDLTKLLNELRQK